MKKKSIKCFTSKRQECYYICPRNDLGTNESNESKKQNKHLLKSVKHREGGKVQILGKQNESIFGSQFCNFSSLSG